MRHGLYFSLAFVGILTIIVGGAVRLRRPNDPATLHFFWLTVAFFGAMALERGAHHGSTSSGTRPATSDESDDFGFFDNGGLSPSQGQPSTSTQTS